MSLFVKICGLRHPDDVRVAIDAGVDAIGIVREPGARRAVADIHLADLLRIVPPTVLRVAVYVTAGAAEVHDAAQHGFEVVQAFEPHGTEDALASTGLQLLAALRDGADVTPRAHIAAGLQHSLPLVVLDAAKGGGSGQPADTRRASQLARTMPMVLAGGLSPASVASVVERVRPSGVDVSSGVEAAMPRERTHSNQPARKCHDAIRAFVRNARAAAVLSPSPLVVPPYRRQTPAGTTTKKAIS